MKGISLIGFMGAGKSTIGMCVSKALNFNFVDTDKFIEDKLNLEVSEIFAKFGEAFFREQECGAVNEINFDECVVACGGGLVLNKTNREELKAKTKVIFINTPFEVCFKRICNDNKRPIAKNNTADALESVYKSRLEIYKSLADFTVSGDLPQSKVCSLILKYIEI